MHDVALWVDVISVGMIAGSAVRSAGKAMSASGTWLPEGAVTRLTPRTPYRFGAGLFGDDMNEQLGNWLRQTYPDATFTLNLKPGQNGIDVIVERAGASGPVWKYAECKPRSASGMRKFARQMFDQDKAWIVRYPDLTPENLRVFTYDAFGYIFEGW